MSGGDEQATSFGDPNARPPTSPRISTTAIYSSPLLATPKRNSGHFDEATGWTPRFAEDYSVFNSTPGNLRGSPGALNLDASLLSPVPSSTGKRRPLSAEGFALEIATHANHFSVDLEKLPPGDAARRLSSSLDPLKTTHKGAPSDPNVTPKASQPQQSQRSAKRSRTSGSSVSAGEEARPQKTQTATPPRSSRGGRKFVPALKTDKMHNQSFGQADFSSAQTPRQAQLNTAFVSGSPEDVFGYPMASATTPPMRGARPFWGMDLDTSGMGIDVDLSAASAELFQTTPTQDPSGRAMNPSHWGRANEMFQQTGMVAQPQPQHEPQQAFQQSQGQKVQQNQSAKRERRLAPKTAQMSTTKTEQSSQDQRYSFGSFQMSMDDPFSTSPGGVDPGMVFSQMPSSSPLKADATSMSMSMSMSIDPSPQRPTSLAPAEMPPTMMSMNVEPTASKSHILAGDTRRTGSTGGRSQRKALDRASAISPTKNPAGRSGLSRSFSESARGGKRTVGGGRSALPALAPARPVTVHQPSLPPPAANKNSQSQSQGTRSSGRRSPLKSSHHHRLSSLTSIPENGAHARARPRSATRTSVKFVIDENGRARAETVMDEDEPEPVLPPVSSQQSGRRTSWGGFAVSPDDDGYPSSSDDEPIIIPSRKTSLNYPEPPKSSGSATSIPPIFTLSGASQGRLRSNSDRQPFSSSASLRRNTLIDQDSSSTADYMDIDQTQPQQQQSSRPSTGSSLGDAAAELRKVMQAGISKRAGPTQQPPPPPQQQQKAVGSGGSSTGHRQRFTPGQRSSSSTISEASLPTPSPTRKLNRKQKMNQDQGQIRCVCHRPEAEVDGAGFLVKCDSCEKMLHGRCIDLPTAQDVPHVYICAFCANTPMRGGRLRYIGRNNSTSGLGSGAAGVGGDDDHDDEGGLMGPPVSSAVSASSPLAHKSFRSFR
ncbi:hypothetical protein VM1G_00289 [Cytospora mali]|uniref:Zinc finger PHD-type domain-containing protein n=1 Tax=Cytospora mali TaxID=578113 RepID=A0A194VNN2_CYTMA|nr:hypothetical protein VM1G_00289 [Valsa mali]